jgi:Na+/citrate or Na+/malate symporter
VEAPNKSVTPWKMEGASVTVMRVDGIAEPEPAEEPAARQNGNTTLSTLGRIIHYVIVYILEYVDLPTLVKCASLSNTLRCLVMVICQVCSSHWKALISPKYPIE